MSVAILPSSPVAYGQPSAPSMSAPGPSPAKRPKLSLDTQATPPAFGKASTSLRLETLSATSPTARHTFQNGYSVASQLRKPGVRRPALKPLTTTVPPDTTRKPTPLRTELHNATESFEQTCSSSTSATSASTIDTLSAEVPYKWSYNIRSILRNGPLPRDLNKRRSSTNTKPMFPTAKKVAFRAPLTEEISTTKYTLAHSDLESSSSTISTLELPPAKFILTHDREEQETTLAKPDQQEQQEKWTAVSPQTGHKRDSSSDDEEDNNEICPATPVAGRKKRHRQWVWTLGPIENTSSNAAQAKEGLHVQGTHTTTANEKDGIQAANKPIEGGEEQIDSAS
ncbi:hypothetical protein LTR62_004505 [Meristemomyces frigidus]|uniref:Uncharacterized protein n=1 Tax=Meristemomyces frigidus TaxID=1508187 RepID=A0AAN7TGU3_9PEZI|nr:hypothetical protein LTR62_004505 [Meristemomyces frigidus]